jgi:serine/threonine-protein kinase PknG
MLEAALQAGDLPQVVRYLEELPDELVGDWRWAWYEGRLELARRDAAAAQTAFGAVVTHLPGEPVPKLALASAHELAGDLRRAIRAYELVLFAHPTMTSAAFGLARCQRRLGDTSAAAAAYERVAPTSHQYVSAQLALVQTLLFEADGGQTSLESLRMAATALERITGRANGLEAQFSRAAVFTKAVELAEQAPPAVLRGGMLLLGEPLARPQRLRRAAERELRLCARLAATRADQIAFVDAANAMRPLTLV